MLYEQWKGIAGEYRAELALWDCATGKNWTFGDLHPAAEESLPSPDAPGLLSARDRSRVFSGCAARLAARIGRLPA